MLIPVLISIDESKKDIPGYLPQDAEKFHALSAKLANKHFDKEIKRSKSSEVILMSGGSASGKTEFLAVYLADFDGLIFDSTLSTKHGAEIKINQIKKFKKKPIIYAIFPDDLKRAFLAFLHRDRKFSDSHFYRTHSGARKTLLEIAENYPEIDIQIHESSFVNNVITFKKLVFKSKKEQIEFLKSNQYTEAELLNLIKNL